MTRPRMPKERFLSRYDPSCIRHGVASPQPHYVIYGLSVHLIGQSLSLTQ